MRLFAASVGGTLLALSLLHLYWTVRGSAASVAIPTTADGRPLFHPGASASGTVALALMLAAALVFAQGRLLSLPLPDRWIRIGTSGVAIALAARAIGDFRYVGLSRRVSGTRFSRWDAWLFTPLCLLLCAGIVVVVAFSR